MMNNEEAPRNTPYQGRKPMGKSYENRENRGYSGEKRYGQSSGSTGYNSGYNNSSSGSGSYSPGQHPHRGGGGGSSSGGRVEQRFRRDPVNYSEKLTRQNDLIIKLLKEIRDRLPAPAFTPAPEPELEATSNRSEGAEHEESGHTEQPAPAAAMNQQSEDIESSEDSRGNG